MKILKTSCHPGALKIFWKLNFYRDRCVGPERKKMIRDSIKVSEKKFWMNYFRSEKFDEAAIMAEKMLVSLFLFKSVEKYQLLKWPLCDSWETEASVKLWWEIQVWVPSCQRCPHVGETKATSIKGSKIFRFLHTFIWVWALYREI